MTVTMNIGGLVLEVQRVLLRPDDRVVLHPARPLTKGEREQVLGAARLVFPEHAVILLDGLELSVVAGGE